MEDKSIVKMKARSRDIMALVIGQREGEDNRLSGLGRAAQRKYGRQIITIVNMEARTRRRDTVVLVIGRREEEE